MEEDNVDKYDYNWKRVDQNSPSMGGNFSYGISLEHFINIKNNWYVAAYVAEWIELVNFDTKEVLIRCYKTTTDDDIREACKPKPPYIFNPKPVLEI